jgi:hypothetical protein
MFGNPSLMTRMAVGKIIGFVVGLIGFIFLTYYTETSLLFRWGILLWYTTFGLIIALLGVMTYHPILKLPFPWWFRSAYLGAWMNFVLTFFAYDVFAQMMIDLFGKDGFMLSPFWFTLEGAIIGLLIGYFATALGGEGKETVGR